MKLDEAYANAAHIPNGMAYPVRWAKDAADFRDRPDIQQIAQLNQPYGPHDRMRFDLFQPPNCTPAKGVFIFVHGGYWLDFDKSYWSHLMAGALGQGWAAAVPSYVLAPEARISEMTQQISQAIQTIAAQIAGPIALAGHSAGGHLVAMQLTNGILPRSVADRIEHVMPISPLGDLRPLLQTSMAAQLNLDPEEATAQSPGLLPREIPAPVTIWVGANERPAFLGQAQWLAAAWESPAVFDQDRHHFDVIDGLADPNSEMMRTLLGGIE